MEAFFRLGGLPPEYRCNEIKETLNWTYERWLEEGTQHFAFGLFCFIYGVVCIFLYILCTYAVLQPDLRIIMSYKCFTLMCFCQIYLITLNGVFTGLFLMKGTVYCNYPLLTFLLGMGDVPAWMGFCAASSLLGFARVVDIWSPKLHDKMFQGKRSAISFLLIFMYMIFAYLYAEPILFNSRQMTWVFEPYVYPNGNSGVIYVSFIIIYNNVVTVSLTVFLNILFILSFLYKYLFWNFELSSHQKQFFMQSFSVSLSPLIAAGIYVYLMIAGGGGGVIWLNVLELVLWQLSSVCDLVLFLGLNSTTRGAIVDFLRRVVGRKKSSEGQPITQNHGAGGSVAPVNVQ